MVDDRLQGILFSQPGLLDLTPKTYSQRLSAKMLATKRSLHAWKRETAALSAHLKRDSSSKKADQERQQMLEELAKRFKIHP